MTSECTWGFCDTCVCRECRRRAPRPAGDSEGSGILRTLLWVHSRQAGWARAAAIPSAPGVRPTAQGSFCSVGFLPPLNTVPPGEQYASALFILLQRSACWMLSARTETCRGLHGQLRPPLLRKSGSLRREAGDGFPLETVAGIAGALLEGVPWTGGSGVGGHLARAPPQVQSPQCIRLCQDSQRPTPALFWTPEEGFQMAEAGRSTKDHNLGCFD